MHCRPSAHHSAGTLVYRRYAKWSVAAMLAFAFLWIGVARIDVNESGPPIPTANVAFLFYSPFSTAAPAPEAESTIVPATNPTAATQSSVSLSMAKDAAMAKNLRGFVHGAKQRPSEGGRYYSRVVLEDCVYQRGRMPTQVNSGDSRARQEASARLSEKAAACAEFTVDELQGANGSSSIAVDDPVEVIARSFREPRVKPFDDDEKKAIAAQVMAAKDPHMLAMLPRLMQRDGITYVDGQPHGGLSPQMFVEVLMVVPCAFGAVCDATHPLVVERCATKGSCAPDVFEMYRRIYHKPGQFETFMRIYTRATHAISAGDIQVFAPPSEGGNR